MNRRALRRAVFVALSLAFGLALCVYVFRQAQIGWNDLNTLRHSLSPLACLVVLVLSHALMLVGARKWAILSAALRGPDAAQPDDAFFLRHFLWQSWVGQFVPPSLAIILGRGLAERFGAGGRISTGLWSGLLDQAMAFALLSSFAGGSVLVLFYGGGVVAFLSGAAGGVAPAACLAWSARRWLVPEVLRQAVWPLFFWSFVRGVLVILRLVIGVQALGLFLSCLYVAALSPVISLLALIPLTPGNLGIAEWGWQAGLVWTGQGVVAATLYAAGFRLLILVAQTLLLGFNELYGFFSQNRT